MRVGLQTWGTEGDLRPFMALARGLRRAGHDVTLVYSTVDGRDHPSAALGGTGIELVRIAPHVGLGRAGGDALALLVKEGNPLRQLDMTLSMLLDPVADVHYEAALELCAKTDMVVTHMILYPVFAAVEKCGRALVTLSPVHMAFPSREIAPLGAPSWPRWLYPFWWWLAGFAIERVITRRSNDLRRRVGLPPVRHILRLIRESPGLNLIAVSSVFCNRPRDWNPGNELCGFFDLGDDQGWQMPPDLEAFLRAGPAPVFFGLGSVLSADPSAQSREQSVRLLVDAAGAARCRAIVQACWAELNFNVPSSVFRLERAPHKAVFPHCAAIVHAGGAGTTHTALRAGVPSVVVPHANDQIAWAKELHRLGVAPAPIPRRKATVAKLALAIEDVLAHPAMREHAQLLAVTMKDEDGVARAIALLEAQRRAGLVSETRMAPKLESV